jgi:hypothetical protein
MSLSVPQVGHSKWLMFSTSPSVGMFSFWYMRTARRLSASDTCCGVVTTIAPETGTVWLRLSATSPVPGGMSTTGSRDPPRHLAEELLDGAVQHRPAPDDRRFRRFVRKPIDTTWMPWFSAGRIFSPSVVSCAWMPSMIGTFGP